MLWAFYSTRFQQNLNIWGITEVTLQVFQEIGHSSECSVSFKLGKNSRDGTLRDAKRRLARGRLTTKWTLPHCGELCRITPWQRM